MRHFELERHRNTAAGTLPYGVERLIMIARALAASPRALLVVHRGGAGEVGCEGFAVGELTVEFRAR